jgi:hypothetical protein
MSKEKLGAKVALKAEVKKIVAKEHQTIEYIGLILKGLLADGHSQRSIVAEWSAQAGRTISQATVSQYVAIVSSKSGANAQALLKAVKILMGPGTLLVIENHYLGSILQNNQFDTFYHEHPRTYSAKSFRYIAETLGAVVVDQRKIRSLVTGF